MSGKKVKDAAEFEREMQERREFRVRVYARHNGLCFYCDRKTYLEGPRKPNAPLDPETATVDHIIPKSVTGVYIDDANVVLACHACNGQRLSMNAETFLKLKHTERHRPVRWFIMHRMFGISFPGDRVPKELKEKRRWYRKHAERIRMWTAATVATAGSVAFFSTTAAADVTVGLLCISCGLINVRTSLFTGKSNLWLFGLKP